MDRAPAGELVRIAPLGALWRFAKDLPLFLHEMRGFPRRARYTVATRGLGALLTDVRRELGTRLARGTLAPRALAGRQGQAVTRRGPRMVAGGTGIGALPDFLHWSNG